MVSERLDKENKKLSPLNTHDWLKYYLEYQAQMFRPSQLIQYSQRQPPYRDMPSYLAMTTALLPATCPAYFMILEEAGRLPNIPGNINIYEVMNLFDKALQQSFAGKNIFFLPGRNGQEAIFARDRGAKVGLSTDYRYIKGAFAYLNPDGNESRLHPEAQNINMLVECRIENILQALAPYRRDLSWLMGHSGATNDKHTAIIHRLVNPHPDVVICTNMFSRERTGIHSIDIPPLILLNRLLALGTPNTRFYITPTLDTNANLTRYKILNEIADYADVHFFDSEKRRSGGMHSKADFAFSVKLKKPVPVSNLGF